MARYPSNQLIIHMVVVKVDKGEVEDAPSLFGANQQVKVRNQDALRNILINLLSVEGKWVRKDNPIIYEYTRILTNRKNE